MGSGLRILGITAGAWYFVSMPKSKKKSPKSRLLDALGKHFAKMPAKSSTRMIEKLNRLLIADRRVIH